MQFAHMAKFLSGGGVCAPSASHNDEAPGERKNYIADALCFDGIFRSASFPEKADKITEGV